jgi:GTP-binding protein LepA
VDASQGVEAQTLANTYLALHHNLEIIPVINKIDLPSAEPERIREQIEHVIGLDASGAVCQRETRHRCSRNLRPWFTDTSARGAGRSAPALVFDSWFDPTAVITLLRRRRRLRWGSDSLWSNGRVRSGGWGYQCPSRCRARNSAGEVGFLFANIKTVSDAKIGDTITDHENPAAEPLPGFEEIKPMVFAGLYPVESHEHGVLRDALEKLRLNDSAFSFEPENSVALGFGFRCGFLGLLHLEIVQERLERESIST